MRFAASLTLLLALALPVAAGDLAFAPAERSPLSGLEQQLERIPYAKEVQQAAREAARPLAKERLRAYLPRGYREQSTKRYGLLVWVSPGRDGRIPRWWLETCDRRGVIAIGADDADNTQPIPRRIGLALDGLTAAQRRWRIDPERVWVAGFSGGGNVACWLGLHYPELFRGVLACGGCDSYAPIPVPGREGSFWRGTIPKPPAERFALAKSRPWVLLAGEGDATPKLQAGAVAGVMRQDGFAQVETIVVPRLEHRPPPAKPFARALKLLRARE